MTAYLIGDLHVLNPEQIADYRSKALPLVEKFGGRAVALDATPLPVEGNWTSSSMILLEFPNKQAILDLFSSDEYKPLARQRQAAAHTKLIAVDAL
jgi:uncharacterized protein (DUF1330 family)